MPSEKPSLTWTAFLAVAFMIVGLTGLFATYAVPLPLQRALAREATLDEALAVVAGPDAASALDALRPRLDDSAAAILPAGPGFENRVANERVAMRRRFAAESAAAARRLRLMIGVVTVMAAVFGAAILHTSRRA